jgi:dephospho-CoA kinase
MLIALTGAPFSGRKTVASFLENDWGFQVAHIDSPIWHLSQEKQIAPKHESWLQFNNTEEVSSKRCRKGSVGR